MTFAADAPVVSKDEVIDQLNAIDFGRDITFTVLPKSKSSNQELVKFNSVKDAEAYLKKFVGESSKLTMPSKSSGQNSILKQINDNALLRRSGGWYDSEVWWWGGGNTSLLGITHAEVKYYYDGSDISNITVKNSYMTGLVGAKWTHRRGSATPLGGKDAKYSVTGTWLIGLDIYGLPVGASFNSTIESPTITMDIN